MKTGLNSIVAGLGALSHRISEDIAARNECEKEKEHYSNKVGKLLAEFNAAAPESAKEKLAQNQAKLSSAMSEFADWAEKVCGTSAKASRDPAEWTSAFIPAGGYSVAHSRLRHGHDAGSHNLTTHKGTGRGTEGDRSLCSCCIG